MFLVHYTNGNIKRDGEQNGRGSYGDYFPLVELHVVALVALRPDESSVVELATKQNKTKNNNNNLEFTIKFTSHKK